MQLCYYSLLSLLIFFLIEFQYTAASTQEVLQQVIILSIYLFMAYCKKALLLTRTKPSKLLDHATCIC